MTRKSRRHVMTRGQACGLVEAWGFHCYACAPRNVKALGLAMARLAIRRNETAQAVAAFAGRCLERSLELPEVVRSRAGI